MPIYELYSQRLKRERGEIQDTLQYEVINSQLRRQALFIISDVFGSFNEDYRQGTYELLTSTLRREWGVKALTRDYYSHAGEELEDFILNTKSNKAALDAIELCLSYISATASSPGVRPDVRETCRAAISEFNHRCRVAGFGFSHENGQLIRIDSQFLHSEAVKPTLQVLSDAEFSNADTEFRAAYEHWREGRNPEALVDALKAFESTMKIIADARSWTVPPRATAAQLVDLMFSNGLLPDYYQTQFAGMRSVLQSGIPTPRNRAGGHGAGASPPSPVPAELVRYVLHQTAATILFLVDSHKARP